MPSHEHELISQICDGLAARFGEPPEVAVVLGSGWKDRAAGLLASPSEMSLAELEAWPRPRVAGHGGEIRIGDLKGRRTAFCTGRVHAYEGYEARELVRGVRALIRWGTRNLLLLNAAGSTREALPPGSLMPFRDHINWGLPNPMAGGQLADTELGFMDTVDLYDPDWRQELETRQPEAQAGVYAGMRGPSYETPAEIGMLARLGVDAVGMSTIPEALAAKAAGARVMAISMITNLAAGVGGSRPSHEEVLATAAEHSAQAAAVLADAVVCAPRQA